MIQVYTDSFKLSQDYYDRVIFSLPLHQLECSCGEAGSLIFYGFYNRKVKSDGELIVFRIQRVKCRKCGKTHAILPASLVPCSQISLQDQQQIIYDASKPGHCSGVMERNPLVDENNCVLSIKNPQNRKENSPLSEWEFPIFRKRHGGIYVNELASHYIGL